MAAPPRARSPIPQAVFPHTPLIDLLKAAGRAKGTENRSEVTSGDPYRCTDLTAPEKNATLPYASNFATKYHDTRPSSTDLLATVEDLGHRPMGPRREIVKLLASKREGSHRGGGLRSVAGRWQGYRIPDD